MQQKINFNVSQPVLVKLTEFGNELEYIADYEFKDHFKVVKIEILE